MISATLHVTNYSKQLYWNCASACVFSCKFAAYFQNTFRKPTSDNSIYSNKLPTDKVFPLYFVCLIFLALLKLYFWIIPIINCRGTIPCSSRTSWGLIRFQYLTWNFSCCMFLISIIHFFFRILSLLVSSMLLISRLPAKVIKPKSFEFFGASRFFCFFFQSATWIDSLERVARRRPGRLLNVLCMLNLRLSLRGNVILFIIFE